MEVKQLLEVGEMSRERWEEFGRKTDVIRQMVGLMMVMVMMFSWRCA